MLVDISKRFPAGLFRIFLRFQIRALSADHPIDSCIARQKFHCVYTVSRLSSVHTEIKRFHSRLIGIIEQRVACENCHALTVNQPCSLASPSVFVIIHSGHIVVDK